MYIPNTLRPLPPLKERQPLKYASASSCSILVLLNAEPLLCHRLQRYERVHLAPLEWLMVLLVDPTDVLAVLCRNRVRDVWGDRHKTEMRVLCTAVWPHSGSLRRARCLCRCARVCG